MWISIILPLKGSLIGVLRLIVHLAFLFINNFSFKCSFSLQHFFMDFCGFKHFFISAINLSWVHVRSVKPKNFADFFLHFIGLKKLNIKNLTVCINWLNWVYEKYFLLIIESIKVKSPWGIKLFAFYAYKFYFNIFIQSYVNFIQYYYCKYTWYNSVYLKFKQFILCIKWLSACLSCRETKLKILEFKIAFRLRGINW